MKKTEFTLIELLVVISIIGILTTLLIPSLANARGKALQALCKSNLKQNAYSQVMYLDGNNDYFCPSLIGNRSWDDSLASYVNRNLTDAQKDEAFLEDTVNVNNAVLQCPADTRTLNNGKVIRSYAMNSGGTEWGGGNYTGITRLSRSVSLAEVNDTTETVTEKGLIMVTQLEKTAQLNWVITTQATGKMPFITKLTIIRLSFVTDMLSFYTVGK